MLRPLILVAAGAGAYLIARWVVNPGVRKWAATSATRWDDVLADPRFQRRASLVVPLIVIRFGLSFALPGTESAGRLALAERLVDAALVVVFVLALAALAAATDRVYVTLDRARERPIKGYLQVAMILAWMFGLVVIFSRLADRPVGALIAGLGAVSAVLLLIFRDTITSLLASVQLTNQDLLRVGDSIEVPSQGADGEVIDFALHTVRVLNWDKTVTAIPTYKLVTESFKNRRETEMIGARRIKRSINVNPATVRRLDEKERARWRQSPETAEYLVAHPDATNLGVFRALVSSYLTTHPGLAPDMTRLVRQLQPTEHGIPLEIQAFTITEVWAEYEEIQAEIIEHLMASAPEFGLGLG